MKKKLPIGLQNLREMRTQGYVYVDKTAHVARLADQGKYYFLARPRRFGKSLLVDTLAEAFAGSRDLFAGLYLDDHWDWSRTYPVKPSLPTFRMTGIGATIWPGMKATGPRWSIACLPH